MEKLSPRLQQAALKSSVWSILKPISGPVNLEVPGFFFMISKSSSSFHSIESTGVCEYTFRHANVPIKMVVIKDLDITVAIMQN